MIDTVKKISIRFILPILITLIVLISPISSVKQDVNAEVIALTAGATIAIIAALSVCGVTLAAAATDDDFQRLASNAFSTMGDNLKRNFTAVGEKIQSDFTAIPSTVEYANESICTFTGEVWTNISDWFSNTFLGDVTSEGNYVVGSSSIAIQQRRLSSKDFRNNNYNGLSVLCSFVMGQYLTQTVQTTYGVTTYNFMKNPTISGDWILQMSIQTNTGKVVNGSVGYGLQISPLEILQPYVSGTACYFSLLQSAYGEANLLYLKNWTFSGLVDGVEGSYSCVLNKGTVTWKGYTFEGTYTCIEEFIYKVLTDSELTVTTIPIATNPDYYPNEGYLAPVIPQTGSISIPIPTTGTDTGEVVLNPTKAKDIDVGDIVSSSTISDVTDTTIDDSINDKTNTDSDESRKKFNLPSTILKKFPFCIPWDLYNCIKSLKATSVKPIFNMPIRIKSLDFNYNMQLDLTKFDFVITIFRWFMAILFVIGLVIVTRRLIKG